MRHLATVAQDHWFVAALSKAITHRPSTMMFFGSPLLLVRNFDGNVWALEDRCPHRGVALSCGRLEPHGLVCRYHGWAFRSDGACTAMPGAQASKPYGDVRVPRFYVQERDGLVWISKNGQKPLPARALAMDPSQQRFVWQSTWRAPILDAQENFLDALHTHTIHRYLVRSGRQRRPVDVDFNILGDGFCVDYKGQPAQSGLLYRLFESQRLGERAYFSALSVGQLEYRYAAGWTAWITLYFTPESDQSTHIFATLHVQGRFAPRWAVKALVWPFIRRVALQDQSILEHQRNHGEWFPGRFPVSTPMDIVRPFLEAAWKGQAFPMPPGLRQVLYL